jgi:diguanylate cyclase (GGDEF)-like protein
VNESLPFVENAVDTRTAQLEILNEVARIATLDLELRPMLQRITEALSAKFGWEFVALATVHAERDLFVCEALTSTCETAVHVGYNRRLGTGVVGEVAATGEPVLVNDVSHHPNYVETMAGARSELCVPVIHRGRLIAVLNIESREVSAFDGQLPLLTTVADQIAGAIGCAQMYAELEERARLNALSNEISHRALEANDVRELVDRVSDLIAGHFCLRRVVFLRTGEDPPEHDGDASILTVPLRTVDGELGTLLLEGTNPDTFTATNVASLHLVSDQLAGAIRLAQANERLAETTAQLESKTRALEEANSHLARAIETLSHISKQDGLTGLANRRHFDETVAVEWRRAARAEAPVSVLLLDLDHFKAFNDAHGHQAGDEMLKKVARCLTLAVRRAADLVARYGGEEFVVLLPDTEAEQAKHIAEELRRAVETQCELTVSIGASTRIPPRDGSGMDEIVRTADAALYAAKRAGRNRVVASA